MQVPFIRHNEGPAAPRPYHGPTTSEEKSKGSLTVSPQRPEDATGWLSRLVRSMLEHASSKPTYCQRRVMDSRIGSHVDSNWPDVVSLEYCVTF